MYRREVSRCPFQELTFFLPLVALRAVETLATLGLLRFSIFRRHSISSPLRVEPLDEALNGEGE